MVSLQQVENLYLLITRFENAKVHNRFGHALSRNRSRIQEIIDGLIKLEKPHEEFDKKRTELCKIHCDKYEDGSPIMITNKEGNKIFSGIEENKEFTEPFEKLKEEYKDIFAEIGKDKEKEALGPNDKPLNFYKVKLKYFPEQVTTNEMDILAPIVWEEEED